MVLDRDGKGFISFEDLKRAVQELGEALSDEQLEVRAEQDDGLADAVSSEHVTASHRCMQHRAAPQLHDLHVAALAVPVAGHAQAGRYRWRLAGRLAGLLQDIAAYQLILTSCSWSSCPAFQLTAY